MNRFKDLVLTGSVIIGATLVGVLMRVWGFSEANIIMSYIVGSVVIARYTSRWQLSLVAAFAEVALFNYFFTMPYYSFKIDELYYVITFTSMLIVAFVVTTLTDKVKQEAIISRQKEATTKKLYDAGRALLDTESLEQTKAAGVVLMAELVQHHTLIMEVDREGRAHSPLVYHYEEGHEGRAMTDCQHYLGLDRVLEKHEPFFDRRVGMSFMPLLRKDNLLGVIGIQDWCVEEVGEDERKNVEAMAAQISLALEREYVRARQHEMKLGVQREKLKNSMLQGISHDLRTPLTGILGSTHTLQENLDRLSESQVKILLDGIHDEASWLYHSVENILNITRFDDGRQILSIEEEVIEDFLGAVGRRVEGVIAQHRLVIKMDDPDLLVPMDANLMLKVLYNLIDNAVKYTPMGTIITLSSTMREGHAVIAVSDQGPGIPRDDLPHIFRRFYRGQNKLEGVYQSRNGIGIGLTICQTIVEAHRGEIRVFNQPKGGTVFEIELPMEEIVDGE
ncbi:MAG: ATP-binding protein [Cellulosilyticaceae bacterium]